MKANMLQSLAGAQSLIELEPMLVHELKLSKLAHGTSGLGFVCGPMYPEESDVDVSAMFSRLREYAEVASRVTGYPVFSMADVMTPEAYVVLRQDEHFWRRLAEMFERVFVEASVSDIFMVPGWNSCPCSHRLKKVAEENLMQISFASPFAGVFAERLDPKLPAVAYWIDPNYRRPYGAFATAP